MTEEKRYNDFSSFLKTRFDTRVQKLTIDAGFTCPNRDGSKGVGGCTYCNNNSFSPSYCRAGSIREQIENGKKFFSQKYRDQKYLAYFQSYSNTYAPLPILKQRYEEALSCKDVVGLVIATRPDTVDIEIIEYLESLAKDYYISVEYGIESTNDQVLLRINRGHTFEEAEKAIRMTAGRGIIIGAHLIFGLPGETKQTMTDGAIYLSRLPINLLKFHQLQIISGTILADEFHNNPFKLYSVEEYLDFLVEIIENMPPDLYLERFINQSPEAFLVAPKWGMKNFEFVAKLKMRLREKDSWQGKSLEK